MQSLTGYPKKELQKEEEITWEDYFTQEYYVLYSPYTFYKNSVPDFNEGMGVIK